MKKNPLQRFSAGVVGVSAGIVFASAAHADSGVPMIFVTIEGMAWALIPIVIIETFINRKVLKIPFWRTAWVTAVANLVSTFIGIPLAWLVFMLIQMYSGGGKAYGLDTLAEKFLAVTWQAPWLIPYGDALNWMIPAAQFVLLIPFFFVSYFTESSIIQAMLRQRDVLLVREAAWRANGVTYTILGLMVLVVLAMALWKAWRG